MGNCCQNENARDSELERIGLNIPAPIPQDSKKNSLLDPNYSKMIQSKNQNNFINMNGLTQPQTNRNSLASTPAQSGSSPQEIGFLSGSKNNVTECNSFISGLIPYKEKDIIQKMQQQHESIGDFVGRSRFSKESNFFRSSMKNFYIITSIYTPTMSSQKIDLYNQFVQKMEQSGCRIVTIEFASVSSPFLVTEENFQPYNFQVRLEDPIYIRFNILNQVLKKLPQSWEWIGIVDYNVQFLDNKWVEKAQDCLRQGKIVQLFDSCKEISSRDGQLSYKYGIVNYFENIHNGQQIDLQQFQQYFEGGKAWAFRKDFLTDYNNLVDIFVTGFEETFLSLCIYGQFTYLFSNFLSEEAIRIFKKIEQIYFKTENQQLYINCQIQVISLDQEKQTQNMLTSIQILNRQIQNLYMDSQGQIHLRNNDNKESKDEIKYFNKFLL